MGVKVRIRGRGRGLVSELVGFQNRGCRRVSGRRIRVGFLDVVEIRFRGQVGIVFQGEGRDLGQDWGSGLSRVSKRGQGRISGWGSGSGLRDKGCGRVLGSGFWNRS